MKEILNMDPRLLITIIGFIITIIVVVGLGFFVLFRGPKKTPNIIFFFLAMVHGIWAISYILGISLHDSHASYLAFMGNVVTIFIPILTAHLVLNITSRLKAQKIAITIFYVLAFALNLFFLFNPHLFLNLSEPKLYLPNFFVPGKYYFLGDVFFFMALLYSMYILIGSYRHADYVLKNRLRYFLVAILYGFALGLVPEFLLYDIPVDPFISVLSGLFLIPMAYSIIQNELLDINVVAKRALWYSLSITSVALLITLVNAANSILISRIPNFPPWLVPIGSAVIAVVTGVGVWKKIREVDILKYEFINVVTHKFRTPLTEIKWATEALKATTNETKRTENFSIIESANNHLVELTNALVSLNETDNNAFMYSLVDQDFALITQEVLKNSKKKADKNNIQLNSVIPLGLPHISGDKDYLQFAVETIIDNAFIYTKEGGKVTVTLSEEPQFLLLKVEDNGIGIAKEDLVRVFSKFFRSGEATLADTEGMGIGLFAAKNIIKRHGGDVSAESAGPGQGSTFYLRVPIK